MFKKILIILIFLLVVIALIFGYNKQKKMDTSNWETYRNEDMGFSIKYPDDIFDIESNFANEVGFIQEDSKCSKFESFNEVVNCTAKNIIIIEKIDRDITDYKNDLKKDNSVIFHESRKNKLRKDLETENFFIIYKGPWFHMNEIFISNKKDNFIIKSSRFNKIKSSMISTFQFLE